MVVICHVNARSLVAAGRPAQLNGFLSMNNVDILCISESWLKPKHANSSLLLQGFQPPVYVMIALPPGVEALQSMCGMD